MIPPSETLEDAPPFAEGKPLIVKVLVDPRGIHNVYIDNLAGLTVDLDGTDNVDGLEAAAMLAIHAAARPRDTNEPLPHETISALKKLLAEARAEEIKMVLGWLYNLRALIISLPDNKFRAWSGALQSIINRGESSAKELEQNIGCLVHTAMISPFMHHCLSRQQELKSRTENHRKIQVSQTCVEDLKLMLFFLKKTHEGVNMNMLVFRKTTHVYQSDSCPAGLGGYSHEGWAWHFYIPQELQFRASNNLLEHIASIITPWIDILVKRLKSGYSSLLMTDSSTSEGWSKKTNFKEDSEEPIQATIRIKVARSHAMRFMDHDIKDYSQWFPGKQNDVADALSRDDDRNDEELTNVLRKFVPSQVPKHFKIVPLPNEISCWLTSLLQRLPAKGQLREKHMRTKLGRGNVTMSGATQSDSKTFSSTPSADRVESDSSEPLQWLCAEDNFRGHLMGPWLRAQSEVPFHMWHRPSGTTTGLTRRRRRTWETFIAPIPSLPK